MPLEPVTNFPYDFHGYKLLKRLGGGFISEAYLAETPEDTVGVPRLICLKIFTDKSNSEPGRYTVKTATEEFMYQRKVLREVQHPFIVCGFPDLLLDINDCVPTELGLCTLEALQGALDTEFEAWKNHFHPIAVKYFAAQVFLAVAHLHNKGIQWEDAKQANIVIQPDFTLRLIDIGALHKADDSGVRDHYFWAGSLHNMSTTSSEDFLYQELSHYQNLFKRYEQEVNYDFQDLLYCLLRLDSFGSLLSHRYWSNTIDDDPATAIDLSTTTKGNETACLQKLRKAAWQTIPSRAQVWITGAGLNIGSFLTLQIQ